MLDNEPLPLCSYDTLLGLHLEPTSRCQAACPMCARNESGGRTLATVTQTEFTLDDFRQWIPGDLLQRLDHMYMCGNLGEPILARDCLAIFDHARCGNPGISLGLNTNGSARPSEFWKELARLGVKVSFGIDGATAASHVRYRRGTDFDRILANAATYIEAGGRATWDFIVFRHNEDEVEAAAELARRMGFKRFTVKPTERFYQPYQLVLDTSGAVVDRLEPSLRHVPPRTRLGPKDYATCRIDCSVARRRTVFISATGHVFPCCYLGQKLKDRPGRPDSVFEERRGDLEPYFAMIDRIGEENLSLRHRSLQSIVDRFLPVFMEGWQSGADRMPTCAHVCGKLDESAA
jgi:MoaA/NifB/PqqE/SkfB family radical SAM enzyme